MAPQEINNSSGPELLANLVNSGLLGVLSVQVYLYYLAFPNDRTHLKCLVYGIYILEFVQSVLIIEAGFQIYVTGFGHVEALVGVRTLWFSVPILTAIDTFLVQGYYAHRISIMGQSKKVAGTILSLSFIQLAGGIAVGVHLKEPEYRVRVLKFPLSLTISLGTWFVGSMLCDIMIALCMTYYLWRFDTTIKQTQIILKKIIRLTIETGSLTAVIAIVCFSLATLPGNPYYYQFPMCIIGKVYANSMLVLINSRMLLGSEKASSTIISALKFTSASANNKDSAIHAHNGDVALDAKTPGALKGSHPEAV